jgi:protein SCO1/2
MTERTRPLTIVAAFVGSLVIGLALTMWLLDGPRGAMAPAAIGGPFQLVNQDGKAVTADQLQGKPTLMFFGYTHCPDVCPTTLFDISEVLRALGGDAGRVNAYFVSVDPERDTPGVMKDYLSSFDPHLQALTGSPDAVGKMLQEYRVYSKKVPGKDGDYTMDHSAMVYLMDRNGHFVAPFKLDRKPDESATDLKRYI